MAIVREIERETTRNGETEAEVMAIQEGGWVEKTDRDGFLMQIFYYMEEPRERV